VVCRNLNVKSANRFKSFVDKRCKYSSKIKTLAMLMYLENVGLRSIGRILNIPYQTISKWIKIEGLKVEQIAQKTEEIEVLEIDEIVTFCKKNFVKFGYGLQLTEIGTKLLILSQRSAKPSMKSFKMDISKTCSKT
jgi:hypothetical protein